MENVNDKFFIFDKELEGLFGSRKNSKFLIKELCTVSQKAINNGVLALKEGRFLELDPLVGDTACQIRASEVVAIYYRYLKVGELSFLDQKFIGLSYFLSCSVEVNEKGLRRTDHKKVGELFQVSKKRTDHMVCSAKRELATLSVEVIEKVVQGLEDVPLAKEVLQPKCRKIDKFKRPLLPCYFTALAALRGEKEAGRPIQLIVEGPQETHVLIVPKGAKPSKVMVTVEGTTKCPTLPLFEQALDKHGLEKMVLTCGAQHVQYGSSDVEDQNIPVEEAMRLLEQERTNALLIGTHQENSHLFMVKHIRARSFAGTGENK
ncbi:MAG: hypothetical protein JSR80_02190 [Verrucomicrobia bacterium]|nr:hypothetical protein [Verrucomicrobiota bacterium]